MISEVYNYLPLLLFCLVYYWDTRSFKAIMAAVLVFLTRGEQWLVCWVLDIFIKPSICFYSTC